jgi:hypothetical protein
VSRSRQEAGSIQDGANRFWLPTRRSRPAALPARGREGSR